MLEFVLIILALGALVILVWVGTYGVRRKLELREFADEHGGEVAEYDEFGLRQHLARLGRSGSLVGRAVHFPSDTGQLYLLEVVEGERVTTAVLVLDESARGGDFELRSHLERPDDADFAALFELEPPDVLDEAQRRWLVEAVEEHGWILWVRRRGPRLLIESQSGRLPPDQWDDLLQLAHDL